MSDEKEMTPEEMRRALNEVTRGEDFGAFNPLTTTFYLRGGDHKMYRDVGNGSYVEADPAQAYQELPDGRFIAVKDMEAAREQRKGSSSDQYFRSLAADPDPKVAMRVMKKQAALQKQFEVLAIDRAMPVQGPKLEFVKDEKFLDLSESYRRAVAAGQGKQCEFQPVTTYQHKLITRSGKVIRPLYQGEVGLMGDTVICLEAGYGTGSSIAISRGED